MNISVVDQENYQDELRNVGADELTLALTKTYAAAFEGGDWNESHDPTELLGEWQEWVRNGGHMFLECRRDKEVVGGGEFVPLQNLKDKAELLPGYCTNSIYINELWVTPEHQGKQVGRFILVNMEQMIISLGYKQISLWTHYTSEKLIKFYSVNGYRDIGDVQPSDGGVTRKVFFKNFDALALKGSTSHD